ncbi:hypothetical protein OIU77_022378 [Salix suchowensis]|uniref:SRR1-like domain-containing protein n=1 Tax=Salix suchowensis TaxID=1278906 RepID=A0ABQ9C025_9ROSI|nr:hypothetical protein OIU77_022378 [Salix suchowensis]
MEASAKLALVNHTKNEDWTVVLPRRGKKLICSRRNSTPEAKQQSWVPAESESDPDRGLKLIQKMGICNKKVESSQFYQNFLEQVENPDILNSFHKVVGLKLKMMVIYGIGSIESYETPRFQLSLAILMKRKFDWIGDMEVFDPILSATESRVLESLGCSVLSVNEHGRRRVTKPTLFYMPHCEAELYNNLLQANWELELLNHIVLFGNSFEMYEFLSEIKKSFVVDSTGHILAARKFTEEYVIKIASDDYLTAFHDSSWHFFSPSLDTELLLVK